mmetsp:Transcript_19925/g.63563  ORF Transcript_19925/g.63563 Transcript_19925/m.63563 type:complete len:220 (+) Transcript_19925:613-1272(+)
MGRRDGWRAALDAALSDGRGSRAARDGPSPVPSVGALRLRAIPEHRPDTRSSSSSEPERRAPFLGTLRLLAQPARSARRLGYLRRSTGRAQSGMLRQLPARWRRGGDPGLSAWRVQHPWLGVVGRCDRRPSSQRCRAGARVGALDGQAAPAVCHGHIHRRPRARGPGAGGACVRPLECVPPALPEARLRPRPALCALPAAGGGAHSCLISNIDFFSKQL